MGKAHNSVTEIRGRGTIAPNAPGFFSGLYVILTNFRVNQGSPGSETRNKKPGPVRRQGDRLTFRINLQDCFGTAGLRIKRIYPPRIPVQKKDAVSSCGNRKNHTVIPGEQSVVIIYYSGDFKAGGKFTPGLKKRQLIDPFKCRVKPRTRVPQ